VGKFLESLEEVEVAEANDFLRRSPWTFKYLHEHMAW
jgi:hypothetical protein